MTPEQVAQMDSACAEAGGTAVGMVLGAFIRALGRVGLTPRQIGSLVEGFAEMALRIQSGREGQLMTHAVDQIQARFHDETGVPAYTCLDCGIRACTPQELGENPAWREILFGECVRCGAGPLCEACADVYANVSRCEHGKRGKAC